MLISFSVKNFRSFDGEQTLNMIANKKFSDHTDRLVPIEGAGESLLRTAVIYGANGSGKSNLIKAMDFARDLIIDERDEIIENDGFAFTPDNNERITTFEFRFRSNRKIYTYGFDLLAGKVEEEWLYITVKGRERLLFNRRTQDSKMRMRSGRLVSKDIEFVRVRRLLKALQVIGAKKSHLLLSLIKDIPSSRRGVFFNDVISWFANSLFIIRPQSLYKSLVNEVIDQEDFKRFAEIFLGNADTGISSLELQTTELDLDDLALPDEIRSRIMNEKEGTRLLRDPLETLVIRGKRIQAISLHSCHNLDQEYNLPISEESDGTRRLLHLLPALFTLASGDAVFVIDELDNSLHPILVWKFIETFNSLANSLRTSQLIATTHETYILDQELLRRDEIWFVEKDARQATQLYSLNAFDNIRNDLNLGKGYLQGRFGAIPFVGDSSKIKQLFG